MIYLHLHFVGPDQPILVKKLFDQLHLKLKPVQSKWQTFTYKLIWLPLNPALFNGSIVDCVGLKCVVIGLDPLSSYIISAVTCYQIGQPICSEHSEILIASTLPVSKAFVFRLQRHEDIRSPYFSLFRSLQSMQIRTDK